MHPPSRGTTMGTPASPILPASRARLLPSLLLQEDVRPWETSPHFPRAFLPIKSQQEGDRTWESPVARRPRLPPPPPPIKYFQENDQPWEPLPLLARPLPGTRRGVPPLIIHLYVAFSLHKCYFTGQFGMCHYRNL